MAVAWKTRWSSVMMAVYRETVSVKNEQESEFYVAGERTTFVPQQAVSLSFPVRLHSRSKAVCTTSANRWSVVCYRHVTQSGLNNNNAVKVKALSHLFPSLSLTFFLTYFFPLTSVSSQPTHTWQLFNYAITQLRL